MKCGCQDGCGTTKMPHLQLSEAYIKDQVYQNVLSPSEGFKHGTVFKDLIRPYKSHHCRDEEIPNESLIMWGD